MKIVRDLRVPKLKAEKVRFGGAVTHEGDVCIVINACPGALKASTQVSLLKVASSIVIWVPWGTEVGFIGDAEVHIR